MMSPLLSSPTALCVPTYPAYSQNTPLVRFGRMPIEKMERHYNELERDLNDIFQKAEQEPVTEEQPAPGWIKELEQVASDRQRWEKSVFDFMAEEPEHSKQLEFLQQQYNDYSLFQEKKPPKTPLALSKPQKVNDYSQATGTFSDFEARISGMSPDSKAVFIGSGPQPNTVITYAKHAGQVTGVDIDPAAVEKAREVTARLSSPPTGEMEFVNQDGQEFDYNPFSHVTIASMVPNAQKLAIMHRISETARPGTKVVIRSTGGLKRAMYAPFTAKPTDLRAFNKIATIHGPDHVINCAEVFITTERPPLSLLA